MEGEDTQWASILDQDWDLQDVKTGVLLAQHPCQLFLLDDSLP